VSDLQASVAADRGAVGGSPAQLDLAALQAEVATSQTLADAVQPLLPRRRRSFPGDQLI